MGSNANVNTIKAYRIASSHLQVAEAICNGLAGFGVISQDAEAQICSDDEEVVWMGLGVDWSCGLGVGV